MDKLKKKRTTLRTLFTKSINIFDTKLKEEDAIIDSNEVKVLYRSLEQRMNELSVVSNQLMDLLLDEKETTQEIFDKESEESIEYQNKFLAAQVMFENFMSEKSEPANNTANNRSGTSTPAPVSVCIEEESSFKLPRIELTKFDGEVHNWLKFWSYFKKVHEKPKLSKEEKFQYLIKSMVPGSKADLLVSSFPPTEDNYDKAVESLKKRFGREDLQTEFYIRELLRLAINNATNPKDTRLDVLHDKLAAQMRSLESLGITNEGYAAVLLPIVESALPEDTLKMWQRSYNLNFVSSATAPDSKNRLSRLITFLESEVRDETRLSMVRSGFSATVDNSPKQSEKAKSARKSENKDIASAIDLVSVNKVKKCIFCDKTDHASANCDAAAKLTLAQRKEIVQKKKGCFDCLNIGHIWKKCRVRLQCARCSKRHATLMCPFEENCENVNKSDQPSSKNEASVTTICVEHNLTNVGYQEVYLKTIRLKLRNGDKEIIVRAFFDCGSENSYITKKAAARMNYVPVDEHTIVHSLFGGAHSEKIDHNKYLIYLSSLDDKYRCNFMAMDSDVICDDIKKPRNGVWSRELKERAIAINDLEPSESEISVLIGGDVIGKLYTGRIVNLKCGLDTMETRFGWVLFGKVPRSEERLDIAALAVTMFVNKVSDMWSLDVLGIQDPIEVKSIEERNREISDRFLKTVTVNSEGRYEIRLPWRESHPELIDNKLLAQRRLSSAVKKLESQGLRNDYDAIFNDWFNDGVIERVPVSKEEDWGFYMPHRPVIKENSTTRVRPVFDASAKDRNLPSLNECLDVGPNLLEQVTVILNRFRLGEIGVVADIKKAFLQISVAREDRDFLRFLWYDKQGNLIMYRHKRVVFGVSSSPFILNAIINFHLQNVVKDLNSRNDERDVIFIENILKLSKSFYVDNCITCVDSIDNLNSFINDAKFVMSAAKFDLRGWEFTDDRGENRFTNVLGLIWDKTFDHLSVKAPCINDFINKESITRADILSLAHRIFDPLGFICPILLTPRILIQDTWSEVKSESSRERLSWDDEVSTCTKESFLKWAAQLKDIGKFSIPRCVLGKFAVDAHISLHSFCDASMNGYASVVYLRVENCNETKVYFLQAKNRVVQVSYKKLDSKKSIPRLELLAASINARLTQSVLKALQIENINVYYWSDSTTALSWIKRQNNWDKFVSYRVKEIRSLSSVEQWRYVPGSCNPADIPSRGCTVAQLLESRWLEGPTWLNKSKEFWPENRYEVDETVVNAEQKKGKMQVSCSVTNALSQSTSKDRWFINISSFVKIVRIIAWIKRFFNNCKDKKFTQPFLTFKELVDSENILFKIIQSDYFSGLDDDRIKHYSPFFDENGLIRLKTRILLRDDVYDFKYPIVLPKDNKIVDLIIKIQHENLKHAGTEITMNALREKYWVLGGRRVVRAVIRKCVACRRHDSSHVEAATAPLPLDRIRDAAIFEIIGVDYAGPIYLKGGEKAWICLFTCAVYRAVHLELATGLSTPTFLMALRRFIDRRGRPSIIFSDHGSNFEGLNNCLQRVDYKKLAQNLAIEKIQWRFNPPAAPWWGGFWERLNGVLKRLLRRTLKKTCLDYEEMQTVITDCESVINSRPITFLSENDPEIVPLTPAMFLHELKEVGVADLDRIEEIDFNKKYAYRKSIAESLRQRFRSEYLGALKQTFDKRSINYDLKLNDIVLIETDNVKRVNWPLARVKALVPGVDGKVRVVRLQTATGELTRPVQRVFPLEVCMPACKEAENEKAPEENLHEVNEILRESFKTKTEKITKKIDVKIPEQQKITVTKRGRMVKPPNKLNL